MPDGLKRYYGRGDLHFVTFSCYRRLDLLRSKRARTLFVQELARVRRERRFWLAAYVVMPNHVHMLMSEPIQGSVSTALQLLKHGAKEHTKPEKGKPKTHPHKTEGWGTLRVAASRSDIAVCARG
jgi:putative transposase